MEKEKKRGREEINSKGGDKREGAREEDRRDRRGAKAEIKEREE